MLLCAFVCALVAVTHAQNELRVNTTQGVVIGSSATDGQYFTFYGLHYAGSTSGENRFKAPTPAPVYPGDFHAVDSTVLCAQPSSRGLIGVEDCLTLNVFTTEATSRRPVLVWLNGAEYTSTTSVYSFRRLVEQGLVVVSMNYRLSIFGFLCLGVPDAPGNAGLKDVVQGLKWIRDNIAGFGGDPNNVSLFGHGSSAAMVDLITMSRLADNLIHKAIAQSGSALAPWAIAYDPVSYAQAVGDKLGYAGKSTEDLAKHLVNTDITVLAGALNDFDFQNNTILFAPCLENPNLNPNDTFLSEAPIDILRSGNYNHVPYIGGYTDREGTLRAPQAANSNWLDKMQANFTDFLQADLEFESEANRTAVARSIREFYFAQKVINMETIEDYLDYHGDTMILVSMIRNVRERALTSRSDVRLYEFTFRGTLNTDWIYPQIPLTGVRHGGVLNFLFDFDLRSTDEPVMRSLVTRFASFASTGIPTGVSGTSTTWLAITRGSTMNYLYYSGGDGAINGATYYSESARSNPHEQRMTFWNDIYSKYYKPPRPVSSANRILAFAFIVVFVQFFILLL